jgi:hypothetical protein
MKKSTTLTLVLMVVGAAIALGASSGPAFRAVPEFLAGFIAHGDLFLNVVDHRAATPKNQNFLEAIPQLGFVALGTMTNGTTETTAYMDDTPDGEWAEVDAGTNVALTASTTTYFVGAKSLKIAFAATAVSGDGAQTDITNDDLGANESVGFWIYSDAQLTAGDLKLWLDDTNASPDPSYNVPAIGRNEWTWVEVDVSGCDGNCDVVDKIQVLLSSAGATNQGAFNVYLDYAYKWDAADEEALSLDVLGDGGVLAVMAVADAAGSANTPLKLVEATDYFVNWQSGNDVLVTVTNQSANSAYAVVAYN